MDSLLLTHDHADATFGAFLRCCICIHVYVIMYESLPRVLWMLWAAGLVDLLAR